MSENVLDRILQPTGMSSRPSYYSGCGAERRHLDEHKLVSIWQNMNYVCSPGRADEFAAMVLALPSLAPTEFLKHFHRLVENDWKWSDGLVTTGNGIDTSDKAGMKWATMAILDRVANRVNGRVLDETESIQSEFASQIRRLTEERNAKIAERKAELETIIPESLLAKVR